MVDCNSSVIFGHYLYQPEIKTYYQSQVRRLTREENASELAKFCRKFISKVVPEVPEILCSYMLIGFD